MNSPVFSVIVPVYNGEKSLSACLESLLAQSFGDFEILLVDDGSTDGSGQICRAFRQREPEKIRVFSMSNQGVSCARNVGIDHAAGAYLTFVDCDDVVRPDYLACFRRMLGEEQTVDLAVCGVEQNGKNIVLKGSRKKDGALDPAGLIRELLRSDSIRGFSVNKAFRTGLIRQQGLRFDPEARMCEDLLFCVCFARYVRRAVLDNSPNYVYCVNPAGVTRSAFSRNRISAVSTYEKICARILPSDGRKALRLARRGIFSSQVNVLLMLRGREDFPEVRREAAAYIRQHPGMILWPEVAWKQKLKALLALGLSKGM